MKKIALLLCLGLAGCGTTGGLPSTADISARAKQIQEYTRLACSFVPTIATIASIIGKGGSQLTIAQDICAAVTTMPLAEGPGRPRRPRVNNVPIHGRFVR